MRKVLKNILSHGIVFVVSGIIFTIVGVYAATQIASSQVKYTGNSQSTVNGALDDLYTKANTWIEPDSIDFGTLTSNATGTVIASSKGVCITRNNKVSCLKANNWEEEQKHIKQVFSEMSCNGGSGFVNCNASDFQCFVYAGSYVGCIDHSDISSCRVYDDGSINCRPPIEIMDTSSIDFGTLATNTKKTILASSAGICIKRNNRLSCFKINNWSEEQKHLQQVFSELSARCSSSSSDLYCADSNFYCRFYSEGVVRCLDYSDNSSCQVDVDGSVTCT